MTIFHLALEQEWEAAQADGLYRRSTLDASLDEVGFIHCSDAHQVDGVAERHYAGVEEPLVLLEIDPERAGEVRWEDGGAGELFPHIYGPLPVAAVVAAVPWDGPGTRPSTQE